MSLKSGNGTPVPTTVTVGAQNWALVVLSKRRTLWVQVDDGAIAHDGDAVEHRTRTQLDEGLIRTVRSPHICDDSPTQALFGRGIRIDVALHGNLVLVRRLAGEERHQP